MYKKEAKLKGYHLTEKIGSKIAFLLVNDASAIAVNSGARRYKWGFSSGPVSHQDYSPSLDNIINSSNKSIKP